MLTELDVLKDVAQRLEHAGIAYMLTGSMAMNYYAQPRMTRDIDLVIEAMGIDAARIAAAFQPDYYVAEEALKHATAAGGMFNLLHQQSVIKVDLVVRKGEPFRQEEFARRALVALPGFGVWIATKEDLILSKLVWAQAGESELQRRDVRNLLSTGADLAYLRKWASSLGVDALLEELLK